MSTRANIKLVDSNKDELWFYRHSDGYPEETMPLLEKFLKLVEEGKIRDNVGQAAGWLIMFGAKEYETNHKGEKHDITEPNDNAYDGWKVGAIEPTTGEHGDIDYLYTIDLEHKTIIRK